MTTRPRIRDALIGEAGLFCVAIPSLEPVAAGPLPAATRTLAAGAAQSFAVEPDGRLWGWGANQCGQLGDGTTLERWTPGQILTDGIGGWAIIISGSWWLTPLP